ncbi:hypothetical protein C5167_000120 [Papaver somniferum]|uniref:Secreted protein n=1 Tax=Papaver somniferum TaxID=3469 RepID=A0A4Y7KSH9_PAPSO|nr:hypothetical protein C5167_000120 [Papaver somniferum]
MASFSFAYLFILFSSQGKCSLCCTEQDVSFNFQRKTIVPLSGPVGRFVVLELLAQFIIRQDLVFLVHGCLYEP